MPDHLLAPHPDDEVLGCGGLLALAVEAGIPALIVTLTDGSALHPSRQGQAKRLTDQREREVHDGLAALGMPDTQVVPLGLPDGNLGHPRLRVPLLTTLTQLARRHDAQCLLVTDPDDQHPDHQEAYWLAASMLAQGVGRRLYTFPVSQRLDGQDVSRFRRLRTAHLANRKPPAIHAHRSQTGIFADIGPGFCLSPDAIRAFATQDEMFLQA